MTLAMIFAVVSTALLGLTIDPNDLLGLLPFPWNLVVPLVVVYALPQVFPNLAARPLFKKLLDAWKNARKPMGPATPAAPDATPVTPAAPVAPSNHPIFDEMLDLLRQIRHKTNDLKALFLALVLLPSAAVAGDAVHDPVTSAVKVLCLDGSGQPVAGGSGVVVGCDGCHAIVVTNRHVMACSGRYAVEAAGEMHPAQSLGVDATADLGGLMVDAALPAAPIAATAPSRGATVKLYGFPAASEGRLCVKTGAAAGHEYKQVEGYPFNHHFKATFLSQSGDSGGGVFDAAGNLCAINWGTGRGQSSCVSLADLRRFVAQVGGPTSVEARPPHVRPRVIAVFSADWCRYCPAAKRACAALAEKHGLKFQVVNVDFDNPADAGTRCLRKFGLHAIPAAFILSDEWTPAGGQWVFHSGQGAPTEAELRKALAGN